MVVVVNGDMAIELPGMDAEELVVLLDVLAEEGEDVDG
jgi:hypothetical protein